VFRTNQKNAAAAVVLCEVFLHQKNYKRVSLPLSLIPILNRSTDGYVKALKLAERAIQYADTLSVLNEGYIKAARVCHADNNPVLATRYFTLATDGNPKHVMSSLGLAQMQINNGMSTFIVSYDIS
jgi:RNA polymerase-associated protein CTR9